MTSEGCRAIIANLSQLKILDLGNQQVPNHQRFASEEFQLFAKRLPKVTRLSLGFEGIDKQRGYEKAAC